MRTDLSMKTLTSLRWILLPVWISWTLLICFLMLSSSDGTVRNVSMLFGGTEITDAIGHVVLIFVDCLLLYGVLERYELSKTVWQIVFIAMLICFVCLELAQLAIPSRGASLIDILAAIIAVGLVYSVSSIRLE